MIKKGLPVEADDRIDVARGRIWIQDNIDTNRSAAQKQTSLQFDAGRPENVGAERLRLVKEQADAAALKNAMLRRDLVDAAEVEREWASMLRMVRTSVLAVPSRLRQTMPHLTAHDIAEMDAELRHALEKLSNDE
ncbi:MULTISPECIES: DNA packaging protein [unclassified Rhizobium]|uniref:DNA packaging protein n=1 Tax=unclassified Rhizobium TaxID=2613769 RepID=UPI001FCD3381|nr:MULTISPECIES: DNA packaging protein [unclassified Rhizobium]